ncbi:MAG: hypothetical protein K6G80_03235 [Treponema sp.]|nr:hypothetical protein [Treponema sp.]
MKQNPFIRAAVCVLLGAAMFACKTLQEDTSQSDVDVKASKTATFTFSADKTSNAPLDSHIFEISEDTLSVVLSGDISGHTLYLVKSNPTDSSIDTSRVRFVASINGKPTATTADASRQATRKRFFDEDIVTHFEPPQLFDPYAPVPDASRAAVGEAAVAETTESSFKIGDTRKIFVDTDEAISSFEEQTATLLAIGKNCYVWVVDVQANRAAEIYASEICRRFDSMYRMITNVYGTESDRMYVFNGSNFSLKDMKNYSATGTRINIVLSRFVSTGVVGYFYCKDYFAGYHRGDARACSNNGKYVYINTRYLTTPRNRDMAYSTLAHEFQHMIMYGQKNINRGVTAADWFNEMMSMICEDLMQDELGIADAQSPKNRLNRFAASYYLSGASEFISVDGSRLPSYASLYGFGAYLIRTYGGAAFVNSIMKNAYCNEQAIAAAVSEMTGKQISFAEIIKTYALSFAHDGLMNLNQKAADSPYYVPFKDEVSGYAYPLEPINMLDYLQKGSFNEYGMKFFSAEERAALRPNGFTLHNLGEITSNSLTITFNDTGAAGQKLLLVVSD